MLLDKYPGITDEEIADKTGLSVEDVAEHVGILLECQENVFEVEYE